MSTLSGSLRLLCAGSSGASPFSQPPGENRPQHPPGSPVPNSLTAQNFLRRWSLPKGAKQYEGGDKQNVLLYKFIRSIYVEGRKIRRWGSSWIDEGQQLKIPTDFPGWVCLIDDCGRNMAPCFSSVGQIAAAHVPLFLSTDTLPALVPVSQQQGKGVPLTAFTKSTINPGEVLRVLGVYHDATLSRAWGGRIMDPNSTYAQCVDRKEQVVFVPFSARGRLFAASTRGSRSSHHVYRVGQLLRAHDVPLKVRVICGPLEWKNETLVFSHHRFRDVIIGCKPLKDGGKKKSYSLFEIPVDSMQTTFTEESKWMKSSQYKHALRYCTSNVETWRCQIQPLQISSRPVLPTRTLPTLPKETKDSSVCSSDIKPSLVYRHSEKRENYVSSSANSSHSRQRNSMAADIDSRYRFDVFDNDPPYSTVLDATYEDDEDIYAEVADSLYNPENSCQMLVTTRTSRSNKNSEGTNTFSSSAPSSWPTTTLSRSLSSPGEDDIDDDGNDSYYARVYRV